MPKPDIKDLSLGVLQEEMAGLGCKRYVAEQVLRWLYKEKVTSFEAMTNLSKQTRDQLAEKFDIGALVIEKILHSTDGSRKFLFRLKPLPPSPSPLPPGERETVSPPLAAGNHRIESILMPHKDRLTLCISSQVGCAMGCKFCRTATMGLIRNLSQGEILEQVLAAQRELEPGQRITNIVLMGMGEPLHNYENVISALQILRHPKAFGFGKKQITVSTSGLAPAIEKFGNDADCKLALSLNATEDSFRKAIMPVNQRYPMAKLNQACRKYNDLTRQAITIEYVMFAGLNDTPQDVQRLCRFLSNLKAKINLIPYNEYPGAPYRRPSEQTVRKFQHALADKHFQVNVRYSKGLDILGACGQLATTTPS